MASTTEPKSEDAITKEEIEASAPAPALAPALALAPAAPDAGPSQGTKRNACKVSPVPVLFILHVLGPE